MKKRIRIILLTCLFGQMILPLWAQKKGSALTPRLCYLNYEELVTIRKEIKANNPERMEAFRKAVQKADGILKKRPHRVTDGDTPPTGDPHDFFAIGKYAFPNPDTKDGMPYIRTDGIINPESDGPKYDLKRWNETNYFINQLTLVWFLTEDEKYARKATEIIRTWFLDPETCMNPNFNCASSLPGVYNGMPIGIIFGATTVRTLDYLRLLEGSSSFTTADQQGLKKWFANYAQWLTTSEFGMEEAKATNNHVTWYHAQIIAAAIYSGNKALAKRSAELFKPEIERQFEPDGSMPRELVRNRSFHYSIYGLKGFCEAAPWAALAGVDLWKYQAPNGRSIRLGFDFLVPYFLGEKKWTWESLNDPLVIRTDALGIVRLAAKEYPTEALKKTEKLLYSLLRADDQKARLEGLNSNYQR